MRKKLKIKVLLIVLLVAAIVGCYFIYNKNTNNNLKKTQEFEMAELSEEYKEWLEIEEGKEQSVIKPRTFYVSVEESEEVAEALTKTTASTYPEKYDLRAYNGVKGVKNQRNWGFCWAFAGTSSLESHMLNKTRQDIYNECTNLEYNLNPMHVGYSLAYSFSYDIENLYGNRELNSGGNNIDNILYWTSGIGPVSTKNFNTTSEEEPIEKLASEILVPTENIQVENAKLFPRMDITTATEEQKAEYINLIKQSILDNGAVSFANMAPQNGLSGYNDTTNAVYTEAYSEFASAPHMMLIVGWDDAYSKENFNAGSISGEKPNIDGAWIVQNSWGEDVGIKGYYYYSYEDFNIYYSADMMTVAKTSEIDYDNIYQYNPSGNIRRITGTYAANVFNKSETFVEELTEISFYNIYPNTEYKIYVNAVNGELTGDNVKFVTSYTDTNAFEEYITINLEKPIKLEGKSFAIILEINNSEKTQNIAILENAHNTLLDEKVNIKEGQSFLSYDGTNWTDAINYGSVLIKAFTTNSTENTDISINSTVSDNELYLKGADTGVLITSLTKNVTDSSKLTYEIYNEDEQNVTDIFTITKSSNKNTYYANIVVPCDYSLLGNYKIKIKYNEEVKEILDFAVYRELISTINFAKSKIYLTPKGTTNIIPKILLQPADILNPELIYEIENQEIATVNDNGIITANIAGTTNLTIKANDGGNVYKEIELIVVNLQEELEGTGTEEDPYIIKTPRDLNLIRADLSACYKLNNDIDLAKATAEGGEFYNNGKGWEPIGYAVYDNYDKDGMMFFYRKITEWRSADKREGFSGTLDGNNHYIMGLNIDREEDFVSLFGLIENANIKNLKIKNGNIRGRFCVGSVAGGAISSNIENIYNSNAIIGDSMVGGIIGQADDCNILKVYNSGEVNHDNIEKIYIRW